MDCSEATEREKLAWAIAFYLGCLLILSVLA